MLNAEQRAIVKATVPLLESGGEALTTYFYQHLLTDQPQLRPLFNPTHQQSGAQPRALAHAVLMYARHIDDLGPLGELAGRIIQKHVALHILPEHYPLVGAGLLSAIRDVLGAAVATDAVLAAWGAAYQQLADLLIGAEAAIYDAKAAAPGGWRGARSFRVARKVAESAEITSFYLTPADGAAALTFEAGQYIGLRLLVDGVELRRNYSLSQAPDGGGYRISVKREAGGKASSYLHDEVAEGSVLPLFVPAGNFTVSAGTRPLVLISGGVGITATLAMLQAALSSERDVLFIHAARHAAAHAFRSEVDALAAAHPRLRVFYVYGQQRAGDGPVAAYGRLTPALLQQWLPPGCDVDAYCLGPVAFMQSVKRALRQLGVPEAQSHHEFFGPASLLDA